MFKVKLGVYLLIDMMVNKEKFLDQLFYYQVFYLVIYGIFNWNYFDYFFFVFSNFIDIVNCEYKFYVQEMVNLEVVLVLVVLSVCEMGIGFLQ